MVIKTRCETRCQANLLRFNVLVKPDLFCSFCEKLLAEQAACKSRSAAALCRIGSGTPRDFPLRHPVRVPMKNVIACDARYMVGLGPGVRIVWEPTPQRISEPKRPQSFGEVRGDPASRPGGEDSCQASERPEGGAGNCEDELRLS